MKTTIYELLGMIKDDKAPIKIFYRGRGRLFKYDCDTKDYYCNDFDEYLFDEYIVTSILDDEVEILDNIENNKQDKIGKVNTYVLCDSDFHTKYKDGYSLKATEIIDKAFEEYSYKINEIIDKLNNL